MVRTKISNKDSTAQCNKSNKSNKSSQSRKLGQDAHKGTKEAKAAKTTKAAEAVKSAKAVGTTKAAKVAEAFEAIKANETAEAIAAKSVAVVTLDDIIVALESVNDQSTGYFDRKTGKLVWVYDFDPSLSTVSEQELWEDCSRYIQLPDQYEINEYHMMEVFAYDHDDKEHELIQAITGRGAFSRFRSTVEELGLSKAWHKFRSACYRERAVEWCRENKVEFKEKH